MVEGMPERSPVSRKPSAAHRDASVRVGACVVTSEFVSCLLRALSVIVLQELEARAAALRQELMDLRHAEHDDAARRNDLQEQARQKLGDIHAVRGEPARLPWTMPLVSQSTRVLGSCCPLQTTATREPDRTCLPARVLHPCAHARPQDKSTAWTAASTSCCSAWG